MGMMPSKAAFKESAVFVGQLSLLVATSAGAYWVGDHFGGKVGILLAAVLCITCGVAGIIQVKMDIDAQYERKYKKASQPPAVSGRPEDD